MRLRRRPRPPSPTPPRPLKGTEDPVPARNRALLAWYDRHGRDLPWRRTADPWAILVSEVMLQQTQVARVLPVWEHFLAAYPDPASLAAASVAEVVEAWGDLGYLRRALRLHETASIVAEGGWPENLTTLPGVGPYTAAAVEVFAFGRRRAAIDVNLRRILSRWTGSTLTESAARGVGATMVDGVRPVDWNQAMMDLGAMLCRPGAPRCGSCPVATWCVDPRIEIRSAPQTPFAGSLRQARAAVLKALTGGGVPLDGLAGGLGLRAEVVASAVDALRREGVVERRCGTLRLRDVRRRRGSS